ncbi:DUF4136 domain-containing protein [Robiginitalea aurantiaca]|uniref:DUF4136 domain-containing protein n=1 Tax=Robiginitalea aurantiaca TaxID=3056915 RepID=A0ABT7WIJ4_9FLAO|nr:DUF4136 domain-containing protein [Robiginitalea aurantiaca]MDM9632730.1 DUF4136 domain-containing protein [Robiginitalea aurantiaca]
MKYTLVKPLKNLGLLASVALAFLIVSCYPDRPEFVEEYDVVYTNYSPDYSFNADYTYSLPEAVLLLDDSRDPNDPPEFIDPEFSNVILDNLRKNLNAQGYTEVDEEAGPDLIILASAFDTQFLYVYNPGYWCWYYPWYCGPGWGYPGYAPGYVSGYTTGTLLIQMTAADGLTENEVPVIWTGTLNGLLQGSDANIIGRIDRNLDQAFKQPPFDNN